MSEDARVDHIARDCAITECETKGGRNPLIPHIVNTPESLVDINANTWKLDESQNVLQDKRNAPEG